MTSDISQTADDERGILLRVHMIEMPLGERQKNLLTMLKVLKRTDGSTVSHHKYVWLPIYQCSFP